VLTLEGQTCSLGRTFTSLISCIRMGFVIGHEQQLMRRGTAVLPAMQLPGGNVTAAGEQLDLRDIAFIPLPRFTAPDQALALQVTEMRGRRAAGAKCILRHKPVIAHRSLERPQHLCEQVQQRIFAIAPFFSIQDGKDMMGGRTGDALAE
jgi:hypothetical protein